MPTDREKHMEELLSQALDLCVRARKIDQMQLEQDMEAIGWLGPRCGTPHLWVRDQYDTDLAEWEQRARNFLLGKGEVIEMNATGPEGE